MRVPASGPPAPQQARIAGVQPAGVIFDMDGVLVDSEQLWDQIRRDVVAEHGGTWGEDSTEAMMGMSTPEWARYMVETLGVPLNQQQLADTVIDRMAEHYVDEPPLLPDAATALREVAGQYPTAIASSAPPRIIRAFLESTELVGTVRCTVSSEEVGAGKPAPDVYLEAARGLGVPAADCAAVEDSSNGLRAAAAAGTTVFAVPNPHFPPAEDAMAPVRAVLGGVGELPGALRQLAEQS